MKCLVTGGAGFIGSNIVEALLARGDNVTVLDNFTTGLMTNLPDSKNLKVITGDVLDLDLVKSCVQDVNVVFHLAGEVGNLKSFQDPQHDARVNILGTINILQSAVASGIKKVVYSASSAIFGEPQYLPIDEPHPIAPESFYAISKLSAERYCLTFAQLYDINTVCLRYFNVYGPKQVYSSYANVIPIFAESVLQGQSPVIYGDGEQTRDFVAIQDVVQANLLAATGELKGEAFNIGSGEKTTVNRLNTIMQNIAGTTLPPIYKPARKGEVKDSVADISRAKQMLGYQPKIGVEEGINSFFTWYQQNRPPLYER